MIAAETAAADQAAAEEAAASKAASDTAVEDKAAADKIAADKAASDKAAADQAAAEKAASDKAAAEKAAAEALAATPPEAVTEAPVGVAGKDLAPLPDLPAAPEPVPSLTGLDQALTLPAAEAAPDTQDAAPSKPEGTKDALLVPGQPAGQTEPSRLPQIAPVCRP